MTRPAAMATAMVAVAFAAPAAAQGMQVDIPAGTLGAAADALAQRAGVNIVLADAALLDRRVPAIRGRMGVEAAVRRLARAAGADTRRIGATGWRLTPMPVRRARPAPAVALSRPRDVAASEGDIVVLASKRGTPAWRMAGSVQVLDLPPTGIEAGTPALVARSTLISSTYRGAGREKLFLRGVADSSFTGRLQPLTGLYFGDVRLTNSDTDPDLQLYDMRSVEVLQGPQGTLYGAGSLAGIIRFNPVTPVRRDASGIVGGGVSSITSGGIGVDGDAVVNLPLGPDVAVRAVGYARSEAGFIDKPAIGRDVNRTRIGGGRATVRWWPAADWTIDAIAMGQTIRGRDSPYALGDGPPLTSTGSVQEPYGADYGAAHLIVSGRLGGTELVSATGLVRQRLHERFVTYAFPGQPSAVADVARDHDMVTHETRLSRSASPDRGWVAGIALTNSHSRASIEYANTAFPFQAAGASSTELALFGEGSVGLSPILSIGGGARAVWIDTISTYEQRSLPQAASDRRRVRQVWLLPSASVLLRPARTLSAFLRYQEGRRPALSGRQLITPSDPRDERIDSVEAGIRWRPSSGPQLTASIRRGRWRAIQFELFESFLGLGTGTLGTASIRSASLSLDWTVAPGLALDAAITLNRSVLPAVGNQALPNVAGAIVRGGGRWTHPIGHNSILHLDGWARYEGVSDATFTFIALGRQGGYVRTGLTADVVRGMGTATIAVDNPFNARGLRFFTTSVAGVAQGTPLQPRTVRFGYRRAF